jgi:hypothetical protein
MRNRKGQYSHNDREYKTASERREFQAGVAVLMSQQSAIIINNTVVDLRAREIADLRAKAVSAKTEYNRRLYTNEANRLEGK